MPVTTTEILSQLITAISNELEKIITITVTEIITITINITISVTSTMNIWEGYKYLLLLTQLPLLF